jgi:hypothetical protein
VTWSSVSFWKEGQKAAEHKIGSTVPVEAGKSHCRSALLTLAATCIEYAEVNRDHICSTAKQNRTGNVETASCNDVYLSEPYIVALIDWRFWQGKGRGGWGKLSLKLVLAAAKASFLIREVF